jgi:hypothetical protein
MTNNNEDFDAEAEERLAFWSEFLNSDEGRLIVGELGEDEMKHFHADGLLFELTRGLDGRIRIELVGKE